MKNKFNEQNSPFVSQLDMFHLISTPAFSVVFGTISVLVFILLSTEMNSTPTLTVFVTLGFLAVYLLLFVFKKELKVAERRVLKLAPVSVKK